MKKLFALFIITSFSGTHIKAQTPDYNFDFENWFADTAGNERLMVWEHISGIAFPNLGFFGTQKVTDSKHKTFALRLSRWYSYAFDAVRQTSAINSKPLYLEGYYKYTGVDLVGIVDKDTALISLYLTSWNNATLQNDTIGYGRKELTMSNAYAYFSCPVFYQSTQQPDSFFLLIQPTKWNVSHGACVNMQGICSYLTIDQLAFSNTTDVEKIKAISKGMIIYPNPAKNSITLKIEENIIIQSVRLIDINGRLIKEQNGNLHSLNTENIPAGNYLLEVQTNKGMTTDKIIIE